MTTALQIINRSLKDIGVLAGGEQPTPEEAQDSLDMLNDILDVWSIDDQLIFNITEITFQTNTNTIEYTIGDGGTINTMFEASIANNILSIADLTNGSISQHMMLSGANILPGTQIVDQLTGSYGTGASAVGTYLLNQSYNTPLAVQTITGYHQRPTFINKAYVRVSYSLSNTLNFGQYIDYPVEILTLDQYQGIGIKALPGPWVKAIYYNPGQTLGQIYIWPNPGIGELHLFTQTLFTAFPSLNSNFNLYNGYLFALRWSLAEALMPMFGKTTNANSQLVSANAQKYRKAVRRLNSQPANLLRFDDQLIMGKSRDAGWVLSGGFY